MNDDEFYSELLDKQGSGWRKTLGMESGVAATREVWWVVGWSSNHPEYLAGPYSDMGQATYQAQRLVGRVEAETIGLLSSTFTTPSARTAIPSSNLIADALDVETGGSS